MTDTLQHLDESQQRVVRACKGLHLVLAPPGCGKTHVLTERIRYAHAQGMAYEDMLCLTFTNRAAREMMSRIGDKITDADALSVGSIHRYCSRFLLGEGYVAADASIIDDEEAVSIIADYMNEDGESVMGDFRRYQVYQKIIFFSHLMEQIEQGHDLSLYLHPEAWTEDDRMAFKRICQLQKIEPNLQSMIEVYHNAGNYKDDAFAPLVSPEHQHAIIQLTLKMYYAHSYAKYKEEHHLLDFEDLLLKTYDIYRKDESCKRFPWVQVDEVQDLNAMQLAIVDQLTAQDATVMFLGDEQQAIFSFMGAKLETLDVLRMRCKGHIYHLNKNHRSPSYLLNVFNDYAEQVLHIHRDLLPTTSNEANAPQDALRLLYSQTENSEVVDVVNLARQLFLQDEKETTAIIVGTNREADNISEALTQAAVPHFKVSGRDVFTTKDMKLLLAHLEVLLHEQVFVPWTRVLCGVKVFPNASLARRFVYKLQQLALSPVDLLDYEDGLCYTQDFLRHYEQGEMVVFDTETTGVDTQHDDIIEISAMRIRNGQPVGAPLDLYIKTDKPIPAMLGDKPNPMLGIYAERERAGELLAPADALARFLEYIGDSAILGHNVQFDYHIIDAQLRRHLHMSMDDRANACFDSLKLMRLLVPHLRSYKLEQLLKDFHLEGQNSHQAIDDVDATVHLTAFCHKKAKEKAAAQRAFLCHPRVVPFVKLLRANYQELYQSARARLYENCDNGYALTEHMKVAYKYLLSEGFIKEIKKLPNIIHYVEHNILGDECRDAILAEQLGGAALELNTMKEADFCNTSSVKERIYVTTVHKAKGLEFSNVIVYDASDGNYPGRRSVTQKQKDEDARKLYVAMSRAQRRLIFSYPLQRIDRYGSAHNKDVSPFLLPIQTHLN